MKRTSLIFIIALLSINILGQNDPQALKILDRFSSIASGSPSVSMKFHLITVNQMERIIVTVKGSIIIAKDLYKLEMPDNITWFNGSATWNYLKAEKEVTITKPDKKDNSFMGRPSALFSLYKKGYKTRLIEETAASSVVDLYPEDLKSDLIRMRLFIGKPGNDLIRAEYKNKDGLTIYLVVDEYDLGQKPDPATFVFNANSYKGVEVIDMR
jgi:outer membrane lipoprotein-sorting protein